MTIFDNRLARLARLVSRNEAQPATQWRRRSSLSRAFDAALPLLRRPGFLLAVAIVAFALLAAIVPTLLSSYEPYATSPADKLTPPNAVHWFGTDELGRDLYTRVVHGSSLSVQAALLAVGIAMAGGLSLGVISGFAGGRIDAVIMRFIDVLLALPGLLLALAIVTAIGFGTIPVAIAVGVGIIPGFARTTRAEVLRVKTLPYVEAARLGGASWTRTMLRHILPNAWGPVAVLATLDFGAAILATAGLSFLGFGAEPPAAEWGTLIANGRHFLMTAPWVSLLPGLFLVAVVFSFNHIARTLEETQR
ncbi:ABC transporter permease [Pseudomonas cichorii]|uniref:ABC transporter permease n=1 Tax=Pseudomonas cichorii TaxID=36746 RepID=UPI001C8AF25F|nr:ABC transporter permease [Pseudomonas cichorii]MBX8484747.1 ABC transporter permease [Pseudomonas cichorii]MBX8493665.1 ABC transporter permease [Pseudomonas cichorii]MBX8513333.1 ABC transporter permease [Pseudomonas cichorii]MBX8531264.1 ABC transporter permease [Pseudomonas cichorii]